MVMDMDGQTLDDNANRSSAMAVLDAIQEKKEQDDAEEMKTAKEHGVRYDSYENPNPNEEGTYLRKMPMMGDWVDAYKNTSLPDGDGASSS